MTVSQVATRSRSPPPRRPSAWALNRQFTATGRRPVRQLVQRRRSCWSTTIGTINSTGLLTAPTTAGTGVVTAAMGSLQQTAAVTVTDLPPVLANLETTPLQYAPRQAATPVTAALTVTDPDNAMLTSATVVISMNYQKSGDLLALANTPTIHGTFNLNNGTLTLTGADTVANYQAALRNVTYRNTSARPSTAVRTLMFQVSDGTMTSAAVTRSIAYPGSGGRSSRRSAV